MTDELFLGVDFGGTTIKLGVVDASGSKLHSVEKSSGVKEGGAAVRKNLTDAVREQLQCYPQIHRVGLGFKGPVDPVCGLSQELVGIGGSVPDWHNVAVTQLITEAARELGHPCTAWLENDVTVAALGERWCGAAQRVRTWVFVIVGTGIGAKCFENGKLIRGRGAAGEFGHTIIDPAQTLPCGCGSRRGHLEALASGQSLDRRAQTAALADPSGRIAQLAQADGGAASATHVVVAAREGDPTALVMVNEVRRYLGYGLANLINTFNPELIVVGGSVITCTDGFILDHARDIALSEALPSLSSRTRIEVSALGSDAGVLGAAYLARQGGKV